MRKILVVVVALASMNAFATRARVNALGNSPHLMDTQTVYSNPADMMMMADYVTMETGTTVGGAQNANTEGMITRSMGESKLGLALGHQSENASLWGGRQVLAGGLFPTRTAGIGSQQNPVELSYGMKSADLAWGASLVYSNYNNKLAISEKESSMGLRAGVRMGALDAKLGLGLVNTYENATDGKYKGTMGLSGSAGYSMDNLYVFGGFTSFGYKTENATSVETSKFARTKLNVGVLSSTKKDGNEFFYGAQIESQNDKNEVTPTGASDVKTATMALPIWMGLEVEAASWLTLRGSITQKTLIHSTKTENNTSGVVSTETAPGANSTVASAGVGLKWSKLTLDGSLSGLSIGDSQHINGTDLLGQVGVTYMF